MSSYKLLLVSAIFSLLLATRAHEIVFPPIDAIHAYQSSLRVDGSLDDVDIATGSQFSGLTTFAHLPYVNCFVDTNDAQKYDIAFLGAPFDTVSTISNIFVPALFEHGFLCASLWSMYGGNVPATKYESDFKQWLSRNKEKQNP